MRWWRPSCSTTSMSCPTSVPSGTPTRSFRIGCKDGDPLMTLLQESTPPPVIARMKKAYENRDPAAVERTRAQYAILQRSLAKLAKANAKIMLGCDTGLEDHLFGMAEQHELESMAKAGMTPMQVIVAATSRPAEYLKLDEDGRARGRKGSRFPGARRESPRGHHEHAADFKIYMKGAEVDRAAMTRLVTSPQ